jgi:hypothetical protein
LSYEDLDYTIVAAAEIVAKTKIKQKKLREWTCPKS